MGGGYHRSPVIPVPDKVLQGGCGQDATVMDITPGGKQAGFESLGKTFPGCTGIPAHSDATLSHIPKCLADGKNEFRCEILSCNTPDTVGPE
jgi:hypothetical protein